MTYEERLQIENDEIKGFIESRWKTVILDKFCSHELYSLYKRCESDKDTESMINTIDEIIDLWKDIKRNVSGIERMEEVLNCNHKFEDTGYSRIFENNMVHMQRCDNCGITIQRKSEGDFKLGFWEEK